MADGTIAINARIEIRPETLRTMVENMKQVAEKDEKGIYRIDTAEGVNRLISAFLEENGFAAWVGDARHYSNLFGPDR